MCAVIDVERRAVTGSAGIPAPYGLAFSPDGQTLASGSWRNTIRFWSLPWGGLRATLEGEREQVHALAITPDGRTLASGSEDDTIRLWDADSGEVLRQNAIPTYFSSIAFSPDSSLLAAGTEEGVLFYTVPHGDEVYRFDSAEEVNSLAFSPDGTQLISCGKEGTINIYEVNE